MPSVRNATVPLAGRSTTAVRASPSASVAGQTLPLSATSRHVDGDVIGATGAWLAAATVMVTVAGAVRPCRRWR